MGQSVANSSLVDRLLELRCNRRSGVLRLEMGSAKKQIVLHLGRLAFAESNLPEEHLARILVNLNMLNRKHIRGISTLMKSGKASDEAIIGAGGVDEGAVREGVKEQALAILGSLFAWNGGAVRFYAGERLIRRLCEMDMEIPEALVAAARRAVVLGTIPARLRELRGKIVADPGNTQRLQLPLDETEAFTYAQAATPVAVETLLALIPPCDAPPEQIVARLLLLGLLRFEDEIGGGAAAQGREERIAIEIEDLLVRFEVANLYEILSVKTDASQSEIKAAYHGLAKHFHPDRFQAKDFSPELRSRAEKLFTYITGAYTTLSDPVARANYDEKRLAEESRAEAALRGHASADQENEKMADTLFKAGRAAMARNEFKLAVTRLKECVWLKPDVAKYHHYLGVAQTEIATLRKEAEQHLMKSLELDSMAGHSRLALARLYLKVNLPKRAESQLIELLQWDRDNREALRMMREISHRSGG